MALRFTALLAVLMVGIAGYLWTQELPREVQLQFGDGAPVEGAVVRWFAPPDRIGSAEDLGTGRYAVNGRALALEIRGPEGGAPWIADSLAWLPKERDSVRVWRRGAAPVDVGWHVDLHGTSANAAIGLFTPATRAKAPSPEVDHSMFARAYFDEDFRDVGVVDLRWLFAGEEASPGFAEEIPDLVGRLAQEQKAWTPASLEQVLQSSSASGAEELYGLEVLDFDCVPLGVTFRAGAIEPSAGARIHPNGTADAYLRSGFTAEFEPSGFPGVSNSWVWDRPLLGFHPR